MVNYSKRHPGAAHRPLIDYDLVAVLQPIVMVGTLVGVILNVLFPNYLILIPLVLLLGLITYKTYLKGVAVAKKEKAAREAEQKKAQEQPTEPAAPAAPSDEQDQNAEDGIAPLHEDEEQLLGGDSSRRSSYKSSYKSSRQSFSHSLKEMLIEEPTTEDPEDERKRYVVEN